MPVQAQIIRIVVASPGDVQEERNSVSTVADELNRTIAQNIGLRLEVIRWEIDAHPGFHMDGPQGLIDSILHIEDCDILIGVFWKRFGTPVSDARSGTEHEIMRAYENWKQKGSPEIMLYFSQQPYVPKTRDEAMQWGQVIDFKNEIPLQGLWWTYEDPEEFEKLIREHLTRVVGKFGGRSRESTINRNSSQPMFQVRKLFPRFPHSTRTIPDNIGDTAGIESLQHIQELNQSEGWAIIDPDFFAAFNEELTSDEAVAYFNGLSPGWKEAISNSIPRRSIVHEIQMDLANTVQSPGPRVILLRGAGGEGKSTVLRQVISSVAQQGYEHVLWHEDPNTPLPKSLVQELILSKERWLIASDEADLIAIDLFKALRLLREIGCKDIQFLLACRDTDWRGIRADELGWHAITTFNSKPLQGLSLEDANLIVRAWAAHGERGLGQLAGLDLQEAANQLFKQARIESQRYRDEGSFLGAMLQVRIGEAIKDHVKAMLTRLKERESPGGTLMSAFAHITALHAVNVSILTKVVLARALDCSLEDIQRLVIGPLGSEAAIFTAGHYILTRHRAIAETAKEILSSVFYVDFDEIYIRLLRSAREVYLKNELEGGIEYWNRLPYTFFDKGERELGIRLARVLADVEPHDPFPVVALANLYRKAKQPENAVKAFRDRYELVNADRAYFYEWSTAEGNINHHYLSTWLCGISLADGTRERRKDPNRLMISLSGLTTSLAALYDKTRNRYFIEACGAAAQLGLCSRPDSRARSNLINGKNKAKSLGINDVETGIAFQRLYKGILLAWEQRENDGDFPMEVKSGNELTFERLASAFDLRINKNESK